MSNDFTKINVENILMMQCQASFIGIRENLNYELALTDLKRSMDNEGERLVVIASFNLMHNIQNPCCDLECTFVAIYSKTSETTVSWDDFSDGLAVAHIIPYLREFISNITNRMPVPPLTLKPVNAFTLVDAFHSRQKEKLVDKN